jgi:hypothetical protein
MRTLRLAVCSAVLALCAALPAVAGAAQPVQPGAYHETSVGACTLNFIYTANGRTYVGTAAHCFDRLGEQTFDIDGALIGKSVAIGNADSTETDWALIEVDPSALGRVNPAVKGSTSYPTGVTSSGETNTGDVIQFSGYGLGFSLTNLTRERRSGVLTYDDPGLYTVLGTLIFGDSGGPLVHQRTGKALGIVSRLCIGLCEEEGPTVQGIIAQATAAGFPIAIRTV